MKAKHTGSIRAHQRPAGGGGKDKHAHAAHGKANKAVGLPHDMYAGQDDQYCGPGGGQMGAAGPQPGTGQGSSMGGGCDPACDEE